MTVLCHCGKAATLVMTDLEAEIDAGPHSVCIDCCYEAVAGAHVGRYRVVYLRGVANGYVESE